MYTKLTYGLLILIFSLLFFLLISDLLFNGTFPAPVESDLLELQIRSNPAHTQGIVAQEAQVMPRGAYRAFVVEYYVGDKRYTTILHTEDEELADLYALDAMRVNLYRPRSDGGESYPTYAPPINIIYDRTDPRRHIVGEFSGGVPLSIGNTPLSLIGYYAVLAASLSLIFAPIYKLFMISYVVNNGSRVFVELISIKYDRYRASCVIKCKWSDDPYKVYKGECFVRTIEKMKGNYVRRVPMYILPNRRRSYFIDCGEVTKILNHASYNGYTIDELQELNQIMVLPQTTWFFHKEVTWVER